MIIGIQDREGNGILLDDFQKMPTFGEIVVTENGEFLVVDIPIRHEVRQYGGRWVRVPVITVTPHNPSKTTKKPVKG